MLRAAFPLYYIMPLLLAASACADGYGEMPMPTTIPATPPVATTPAARTDGAIEPRYEAMARLKLKDPAGACRVLDENYPAETRDTDILYLRGRCHMQLKNYPKAAGYYESLLAIKPDAPRAQLELGQVYAMMGERTKAQTMYKGVLSSNPPQTIAKRIEDALTLLDRQKNWYIRTEAGVVYDTNTNSGPSSDQIIVFDTPFTLGANVTPQDSFGSVATADMGYSHALSPTAAIIAQASGGRTDYFETSDFDINTLQVGVGPALSFGKARTILQPNVTYQSFGGDTYRTAYGLTNRTTYKIGDKMETGLSILAQKTNFPTVTGREGLSILVSPDLSYSMTPKTKVSGSVITRLEDAENDIYSNRALGGRVTVNHLLTPTLKTTLTYQYLSSDYDGEQPAFGNRARDDQQHVGIARVDWDISRLGIKNLGLSAKYQYTEIRSNIDIYQFDRHTGIFSMTKAW